jgi:hypothetical protein
LCRVTFWKLHIEELNDLYSSLNIVWVIKSVIMRWGACSTYGGEARRIQGFGGGNLKERDHLGDPAL